MQHVGVVLAQQAARSFIVISIFWHCFSEEHKFFSLIFLLHPDGNF